MFNVKDLEDAAQAMQKLGPKLPKGIKVTTQFADYLDANTPKLEDKLPDNHNGFIGRFDGLPVEIDDEIDGNYEIIY